MDAKHFRLPVREGGEIKVVVRLIVQAGDTSYMK